MTYEVIGTRNFLPMRTAIASGRSQWGETRSPFHSVGVGGEYDQPGGGDVGVLCVDEETAQVVASALNLLQELTSLRRRSTPHSWCLSTASALINLCEVMDGKRDPNPIEPPLIANNP